MTAMPQSVFTAIEAYAEAVCSAGVDGDDRATDAACAVALVYLNDAIAEAIEQARLRYCPRCMETLTAQRAAPDEPTDPRDPDPTRSGFWALHNCGGCENGKHPCITKGGRNYCDGPRARNE